MESLHSGRHACRADLKRRETGAVSILPKAEEVQLRKRAGNVPESAGLHSARENLTHKWGDFQRLSLFRGVTGKDAFGLYQ